MTFPYPDKGSVYTFLGQYGCFKVVKSLANVGSTVGPQASKMEKGVRVVRGPDWKWGNQDRDGEGEGTPTINNR